MTSNIDITNNLSPSELKDYNILVRLGDSPEIALATIIHIRQGKPLETFHQSHQCNTDNSVLAVEYNQGKISLENVYVVKAANDLGIPMYKFSNLQ